jgi:hypothetical protein
MNTIGTIIEYSYIVNIHSGIIGRLKSSDQYSIGKIIVDDTIGQEN